MNNDLGSMGGRALAEALSVNTTITYLRHEIFKALAPIDLVVLIFVIAYNRIILDLWELYQSQML